MTAVLAIISIVGIAFWTVMPLDLVMPINAGEPGSQVDTLLRFMAASGTALFVFIAGYIVYFCIAFRARATDSPDAIGVQIHDNNGLEFWWTLIPTLFVVLLSILSIRIWYQIQIAQPANGLTVESVGHRVVFHLPLPADQR